MMITCRVLSMEPTSDALVRLTLAGTHPAVGPFQHQGVVSAALADALVKSRTFALEVDGRCLAETGRTRR